MYSHTKQARINQDVTLKRRRQEAVEAADDLRRIDRAERRTKLAREQMNRKIFFTGLGLLAAILFLYAMHSDHTALINGYIH